MAMSFIAFEGRRGKSFASFGWRDRKIAYVLAIGWRRGISVVAMGWRRGISVVAMG